MSKAFTKEAEEVPDSPIRRRGVPVPALNFVTPGGLAAARAELDRLARTGGDPDRIRELGEHLATAQPIEPPIDPQGREVVGMGAHVTVEDEDGHQTRYRIVGAIEADPKRHAISWQSPLAQALWGTRVGDTVGLPRGDAEIVDLRYEE